MCYRLFVRGSEKTNEQIKMTREDAEKILELPKEDAIEKIVELGNKAEKYDELTKKGDPSESSDDDPATPSGMKPPYSKPPGKKRKKKPGQKKGHPGAARPKPDKIDHHKEHTLSCCPKCKNELRKAVTSYNRYTEDIPPVETEVTEHTIHGYWCSCCKKIVYPKVSDALPNAMIGIRVVVFTAWLHYLIGVSVNNIVRILNFSAKFKITAGGLTQAWKRLADQMEASYEQIRKSLSEAAVLHGDETGWRINGITHWLWCFATKKLCFYIVDRSRGSPVIVEVVGALFKGILISDFQGAYNVVGALAKQKCFYHFFTALVKTDKTDKSSEWKAFRKKLGRLLRDAIRLHERRDQLDAHVFQRRLARLRKRLAQLAQKKPEEDKDVNRIKKRLRRHKDELFTFLGYEGVSPYNNHAEQQMRTPAINRKISHQNRSQEGAKTQAILMTLFKSAGLQKLNPVEAVLALARKCIDSDSPVQVDLQTVD